MYLSHSKSLLFRFSHGARFRKTVELINAQPGETILDYGCADGRLLKMLPDSVNKIGYDPYPQDENGLKVINDTSGLECCSCDTITVCEVLEHVSEAQAQAILKECRRLLKPKGRLIISVPIEVGLSSLVKSLARLIKVRPLEGNMTVPNVLRSTFYFPVERIVDDYNSAGEVYGHMGFDYRKLRLNGFAVTQKVYSPLPFGPLLNSQVFYVTELQGHENGDSQVVS